MKTAKFTTFTYDIVDELGLGQVEKIAELDLDANPKEVRIPTVVEMDDLRESQVALQLWHPQTGFLKKYACYDAPLTQLNSQLLLEKEGHLPDEIVKTAAFFLRRAAKTYGLEIANDLDNLVGPTKLANNIVDLTRIDELAYTKKVAKDKSKACGSKYALPKKKRYPLNSKEEVEKAAEYFDKYANSFDSMERLTFAMNTCKEAELQEVPLHGKIAKYAGINISDFNENYPSHINIRKKYLLNEEDFGIYEELLEKSASLGVQTSARALEAIDLHYGLDKLWGTKLADPILSTCSMQKEAEVEIDGTYVSRSQLNSLLRKDISGWVDDYTKKELAGEDGLDVFKSLPEPTREGLLSEL